MKIAYYAPMKPPDDPEPSGDRRVARLFWRALDADPHHVLLASRFRSWDAAGDARRQQRLERIGKHHACKLINLWRTSAPAQRPDLWVTYHLYHKAPDWIGPAVASALDIPYLVVEASHAAKQARGRWSVGYAAATDAIIKADAVIVLNSDDLPGISRLRDQGVVLMRPFIDLPRVATASTTAGLRTQLATRHAIPRDQPWLITVAMMREVSKLASFQLLAKALEILQDQRWTLIVIGDGPARDRVLEAFATLPEERVRFLGELGADAIEQWLSVCDLMVWPAIGEAFGMALLEAHAWGIPVVAGRCGGVSDIVEHGQTGLLVEQNAGAISTAVRSLIKHPDRRRHMGRQARCKAQALHDIAAARNTLKQLVDEIIARRSAVRHRAPVRGGQSLG